MASYRSPLTRIGKWFGHYDEKLDRSYQLFNSSRWAEDVTPRAVAWLNQNLGKGKPVFLWVHYFDPHSPYDFRSDFADLESVGSAEPEEIGDAEMRERGRNYDTEIAYMDWHLGKLLESIKEFEQQNSTLVMLTADHGESLGEHGYVGHGRRAVRKHCPCSADSSYAGKSSGWPGSLDPGVVIGRRTDNCGSDTRAASGEAELSGRTLAAALTTGEVLPQVPVYYATFPGKKGFAPSWLSRLWVRDEPLSSHFGCLEGQRKLVWSPDDLRVTVYDLARDADEMQPQRIRDGSRAYEVSTSRLRSWFERTQSRSGSEAATERDLEVLKTLGYTQ